MADIYQFEARRNDGEMQKLPAYKGKPMLIVNVASKCGFTPQYEGLEALYRKHQDKGFTVLAFPCNQFSAQEPGDAEEIAGFCKLNYDVTFPLFAKIDVNGPSAHPLYEYLKGQKLGFAGTRSIKWNFTKFLVDGDGNVKARYSPQTIPRLIEKDIAKLL